MGNLREHRPDGPLGGASGRRGDLQGAELDHGVAGMSRATCWPWTICQLDFTVDPLPYDQLKPFSLNDVRLRLVPGHPDLFAGMSVVGQAVTQALPPSATAAELREIGEFGLRSPLACDYLLGWLDEDLDEGLLGGAAKAVAEILLGSSEDERYRPLRRAPSRFQPPSEAVVIDGWRIGERAGRECLIGRGSYGHPYVPDTTNGFVTSSLVWIDEGKGWAKTMSRHYRLGRPWHNFGPSGHC